MTLPKNLIKAMKAKGLTFVLLARASGVSKSTIHGWSTGRKVQDLQELKRVAQVLEMSLYELAFGEVDPFEPTSVEILKEIFSGDVRVTIQRIEKVRSK